jgi:two-component system, chemotaxis family, protein-glutamate methylesterase/glutaminase
LEKLAVLIIDPSVINRKDMTEIINSTDYGTVLRSASNGQIGLEWLGQFIFDVVLLDVMSIKDMGVSLIHTMKRAYPSLEIIIVCDSSPESAQITLDAMNVGAMDFILRADSANSLATIKIKQAIEAIFTQIKVRQYLVKPETTKVNYGLTRENYANETKLKVDSASSSTSSFNPTGVQKKVSFLYDVDLVVVASSTGGPAALESVIKKLPADFLKPILIVQHMPPEFTHVLAESLNKKYRKNIIEGKQGDVVKPNSIMIAPGGFHMIVEEGFGKTAEIKLLDTPFLNGLKPAADILFASVANVYQGKNILAVVLTGMGNDGTAGIKELKNKCNCYCITQSEQSCVVYGMPKCVNEAGLSDEVVDLNDIAFRMYQLAHKKG